MLLTLFMTYPLIASVLISIVSMIIGAVELEMMKSKGPALITWFLGGLAALSPLANISDSTIVRVVWGVIILTGYLFGIRIFWRMSHSG